jgi:hypothetical protein
MSPLTFIVLLYSNPWCRSIKKGSLTKALPVPFLMQISTNKNENASEENCAKKWLEIRCCISVI